MPKKGPSRMVVGLPGSESTPKPPMEDPGFHGQGLGSLGDAEAT